MIESNDGSYSTTTLYFLKLEAVLARTDLFFININRLNVIFMLAGEVAKYKIVNSIKKGRKITVLMEKFLKIFFHHGLQTKYLTIFNKSISNFYLYFFFFATELKDSHPLYLKTAFSFIQTELFFFFENVLL
jgi:hypothetical protein